MQFFLNVVDFTASNPKRTYIFILVVNQSQTCYNPNHLFNSKTEIIGRRSKERFMLTGIGQKVPKTDPERIK